MRRCTSPPSPFPCTALPDVKLSSMWSLEGPSSEHVDILGVVGVGVGFVRLVALIGGVSGSRKIAVLLNCRACGVLDMSFLRKVRVGGCDVLKRRRLRGGFSELGAFSTLRLARDCNGDDLVVSAESFSAFYPMVSAPDVAVLLLPKVTPK